MKRLTALTAILTIGWLLASGPRAQAQWGASRQAGEANESRGRATLLQQRLLLQSRQYDEMTKVCGLDANQVEALKQIDADRDKALSDWQTANADKIKSVSAAWQEAIKGGDPNAFAALGKQQAELYAPMQEIYKKAHVDQMAVFTPEQKAAWDEYTTLRSINAWFTPAKLTDEQQAKIKAAYKEMAANKEAKSEEILYKLNEKVRGMLTEEQTKSLGGGGWVMWSSTAPGAAINASSRPGSASQPGGMQVIFIGEGGHEGATRPAASQGGGGVVYILGGGEERENPATTKDANNK